MYFSVGGATFSMTFISKTFALVKNSIT